ncbi:MAG: UvrD-helicase domain-containing protein [Pirellulales bacterium]
MSDKLNPPQQHAVQTLSGPLLVLAGAGTGKTRVVTFRVANLIRHGTRPDRILAVTFTNKAAHEMQERIGAQIGVKKARRGEPPQPKPLIGTFHSICVGILRRHSRTLGFPEKFAIYDRGDQESLARGVLRELRLHDTMLKPSEFLSIVGRWKNSGVKPENAIEVAKTDKEHMSASGYRRYQKALKLSGAFDFDDLLLFTEHLLLDHEPIRKQEAGRFDHILVDEYQDTNGSQYRIIKALASDHRNLCVVGDDDQSIYAWRGAEVTHILNFKRDWPEAVVVKLESNYRSTAAVLDIANRLIAFNRHRHDKVLRPARPGGTPPRVLQFEDETAEAEGVANEILRRLENEKQLAPKDFAILFRTNEQPRAFETALRKVKLPYTLTGAQSFFDRKEVRDVLSYLRIIDAPQDEIALLRIINTPPRGLGAKSVETLMNSAVSSGKPLWDILQDRKQLSGLPIPAQRGLQQLLEMFSGLKQKAEQGSLVDMARDLLSQTRYLDEISRIYDIPEEQEMRLATVEETINAIAAYESETDTPSLSGFLQSVALEGKEFGSPKEKQLQRNAISLMTFHSAKGLEFPIVYMVGMEEGILPHRRSVEDSGEAVDEERRLCYVGITRAQDELTLSLPLTRFKWGKPRPTFASRFLYEMTGQADNPNCQRAIEGARKENRQSKSRPSSKPKKKT